MVVSKYIVTKEVKLSLILEEIEYTFWINRYPYDTQNCQLELIFASYSSSEVIWGFLDYNINLEYKLNTLWERTGDKIEIDKETIDISSKNPNQSLSRAATISRSVTKSKYIFSIKLSRNPISAIFYYYRTHDGDYYVSFTNDLYSF